MFQNLDIFQTSYKMARHAGARQAVTAANMANADTPGYRARSIPPFADVFETSTPTGMRATRNAHLSHEATAAAVPARPSDAEASPNGNTVSLEQEMINSVEIQREHSRAMTIYKHSLDVLRMSIGRR